MWRKKTDKRIVAAGIIALSLVIGYQSWQDMQPHPMPNQAFTFTPFALADEQAELTEVPKSVTKVVAWAGDLKAGTGEAAFTPSPLAPVILPQQELMPLFTLDTIPGSLTSLFEKIGTAIKPWKDAGNIINDVYIDYTAENPDLEALGVFLNGLRGYLNREVFTVVQIRRSFSVSDPASRNKLANLLKGLEFFVYDTKDVQKPGETLAETITRLDAESLPFVLRTSTQPDNDMLKKAMPEAKQFFNGFLLDLDTAKQPAQEKTP